MQEHMKRHCCTNEATPRATLETDVEGGNAQERAIYTTSYTLRHASLFRPSHVPVVYYSIGSFYVLFVLFVLLMLSTGVAGVGDNPAVHGGVHVAHAVGQVAHHR